MSNRPNTTCDHYGCDRVRLQPTCKKGHLGTFADARARACVRGSVGDLWDKARTKWCPDRDDQGQEARDAEVMRVSDAVIEGKCPDCGGDLTKTETAHNVFMRCPKCPEVSVRGCKRDSVANEPPSDDDVPHDQDGDVGW